MRYCVVFSEANPASAMVKSILVEKQPNLHHVMVDDILNANNLDTQNDADAFIFAGRHQSASGRPCFCVHTPGNFGRADHGGRERTLSVAFPELIRETYVRLKSRAQHPVFLEATHHGPSLEKPAMFIEIGSSPHEWTDRVAGTVIADTILELISHVPQPAQRAIGIGGPHYASHFAKVMEQDEVAFGHICPKHHLNLLDESMISQMIGKTQDGIDKIYLEWKGLSAQKQRVIELLQGMGLSFERM